ncbi:MAG: hypothetical protein QXR30_03070 [Candidatus Woesearchaeota archaeon]
MKFKKTDLEEIVENGLEQNNKKSSFIEKLSNLEEKFYEVIILDYPENNKLFGRHFFSSLFGSFFPLNENLYLQYLSFPLTYSSYYLGKKSVEKDSDNKKYYHLSLAFSIVIGSALYCSLRFLKGEPIDYYNLTRLNLSFFNISSFLTNYFYTQKTQKK